MLCAATARIGPARVSWWAVWDRGRRTLAERTTYGRGGVRIEPGRVRVDDGPVTFDLRLDLDPAEAVETVSPHGSQYAWTRKRGGVPMRGAVTLGDRTHVVAAHGIVDESAGYHARHTAWRWSAGVGVSAAGAAVAWNLVDGLHDGAEASERSVWIDGVAHEVGPLAFAADGTGVGDLAFTAEATRSRRERLVVVSSDYEQPFGSFSGSLPVAGELTAGWGVMERHSATW